MIAQNLAIVRKNINSNAASFAKEVGEDGKNKVHSQNLNKTVKFLQNFMKIT